MPKATSAPRGTADILPCDSAAWQFIERAALDTARLFGFREIRTPVFEHTELFLRSVGETTDVVQKEMYTFEDRGGRSLTLRPEGTAGAARAFIEHGLYNDPLPVKVCYLTTCYRYEKPQAGRLREHHQFGAECYGADFPAADAEMIALAAAVLDAVHLTGIGLEINSIGCPDCRPSYLDALRTYFSQHEGELCDSCRERLTRNPMRILDCKSPVCKEIAAGAPLITDFLCDDCKVHFRETGEYLTAMGMAYTVNPRIVRGLDYYTRTVFEFVAVVESQLLTVCGGGRYNGLIEELGGPSLPALGFGMGIERLLELVRQQQMELPAPPDCDCYIAPIGEGSAREAARLCAALRAEGFSAQTDLCGRSLKSQMKYADKLKAKNTVILGDDELSRGRAILKNMRTGQQSEVNLQEGILSAIYDQNISAALSDLSDSLENLDADSALSGPAKDKE